MGLHAGWNLISLPLQPVNTSIEAVLGDLDGRVLITAYNTTAGEWYVYDPDSPEDATLHEMVAGRGYWLYAEFNQN